MLVAVGGRLLRSSRRTFRTWRELRGTKLVLQSLVQDIRGKEIDIGDNQAVVRILSFGRRKTDLHQEAVDLCFLCLSLNTRLLVEWVPRDENELADELSRYHEPDGHQLNPQIFQMIDRQWGPRTIDRFACIKPVFH